MVSEPTTVQLTPSEEAYPVRSVPARTSFTQYGAKTHRPLVLVLSPPVLTRRWNVTPLAEVRLMKAWRELAARVSRIITPALAQLSVAWMLATRAMIVMFAAVIG